MSQPKHQMDKRCPRQLFDMPDAFCPQAVQRLKAMKHHDGAITEEVEATLRGCPWAIHNQMASYCFFKYMALYGSDTTRALPDIEAAHLLGISPDDVKKAEKSGLAKLKSSAYIQEIVEQYDGDKIMDDSEEDPEWQMPNVT